MKHARLHSIAHNLADSLSGGFSLVVPNHVIVSHVHAEAAVTADGVILVDFLTGKVEGAAPGSDLEQVTRLFSAAFPGFCARHGVDHADFRACLVRFVAALSGNSYIVTVEDRSGRRTSREYLGRSGRRSREMDALGRLRPRRIATPEA